MAFDLKKLNGTCFVLHVFDKTDVLPGSILIHLLRLVCEGFSVENEMMILLRNQIFFMRK